MNSQQQTQREQALALFGAGYNCAQAVFAACAPAYGLSQSQALMMAAGLGGGIGGTHQQICGALLAAILLLGLRQGDDTPNAKAQLNPQTQALMQRFAAMSGDTACPALLRQPGMKDKAKQDPRLANHPDIRPCARYVLNAIDCLYDAH